MLDYFCIFTRGGFVLWTFQLSALKGSPVDALIQTCLLQERSGETSFQYSRDSAAYTLKWTFHNELGLVFVAVYQRMLQLLYVDELLEAVKGEFASVYNPNRLEYLEFNDTFRQLSKEAEERAKELKRPKQVTNFEDTKKGKQLKGSASVPGTSKKGAAPAGKASSKPNGTARDDDEDENSGGSGGEADVVPSGAGKSASSAFDVSKLRHRASGKSSSKAVAPKAAKEAVPAEGKKGKAMRKWDDDDKAVMKDFSKPPSSEAAAAAAADVLDVSTAQRSLVDVEEEDDDDEDEDEDFDEEIEMEGGRPLGPNKGVQNQAVPRSRNGTAAEARPQSTWLSSMFQSVAGKSSLDVVDLEPSLKALKERLMSKNVAEEIAEKLCRSVESSLVGRKQGSFTRVSAIVQTAMEEALSRILTPKRSVDILRDVEAAKERGRPYVIVFVGVNGVGKSTNLAKVAYWLAQHNHKVMLAACDTFRAGAVEQLRTHGRRLQIPVFEKGYEKDPAAVAKEAIKEAQRTGMDAVLVDTAGRMQDNEPLMRALSKLINTNEPDLVLFVGEALVGNDAVDQLSKFNQRLADLSTAPEPRAIDGILLTKFDTIDDKVGAALSMVYISGAPIVFVGCGQTYTDLRRLNPKQIIRTLLQ